MPPIYDLTVYKLKTRKALKRTARSRAKPDRPLPVSAVVTGIEVPIRTQALQATVKLSDGSVQAQVSGRVDAPLDGELTTQITKLIRHERIPVGL